MTAPGPIPQRLDTLGQQRSSDKKQLEESLRKTLEHVTIPKGGLTVTGSGLIRTTVNGVDIFYVGPLNYGGVEYNGFTLSRPDGSRMFFTFPVSGDPLHIAWMWTDHLNNEVVSSDAETGGLARPWIPIYLIPKLSMAAGTFDYYQAAVSSTERQLWEGRIPLVTHPYIEVDGVWGQASGSNSTTYRLKVGGVEYGSWTVSGGLSVSRKGPYNVSALINDSWKTIEITAQSTGTGAMACHVYGAALRQTPS